MLSESHSGIWPVTSVSGTAKASFYKGFGPNGWGWNATTFTTTATKVPTKVVATTAATTGSLVRRLPLKVRDNNPDWITATIDGIVVSWENNFAGDVTSSTATAAGESVLQAALLTPTLMQQLK